jgi:hypothetical protein
MDDRHSGEPNLTLSKKRAKRSKTKTARAKRQEVSSSFDDVEIKNAAPNPTVDNVCDAILSRDSMNETLIVMPTHPTMEEVKEWNNDQLLRWI